MVSVQGNGGQTSFRLGDTQRFKREAVMVMPGAEGWRLRVPPGNADPAAQAAAGTLRGGGGDQPGIGLEATDPTAEAKGDADGRPAADRPSGLASLRVSASPPGNRKPSPHSAVATASRLAGQSVGSAGAVTGSGGGRNDAIADGFVLGLARPNRGRTASRTRAASAVFTTALQTLERRFMRVSPLPSWRLVQGRASAFLAGRLRSPLPSKRAWEAVRPRNPSAAQAGRGVCHPANGVSRVATVSGICPFG
jgi:hypothetical protein